MAQEKKDKKRASLPQDRTTPDVGTIAPVLGAPLKNAYEIKVRRKELNYVGGVSMKKADWCDKLYV